MALGIAFERLEQAAHVSNAVSDVLSAFWPICGEPHDVVVVDDGIVAHIVQGFRYTVHVHVAGVGDYLLLSFLFGDLSTHVAEVDVEDFALLAEVPNTLKDILARFVAGAYTKGHAVVWRGNIGKEAVKGGEVVENCGTP